MTETGDRRGRIAPLLVWTALVLALVGFNLLMLRTVQHNIALHRRAFGPGQMLENFDITSLHSLSLIALGVVWLLGNAALGMVVYLTRSLRRDLTPEE